MTLTLAPRYVDMADPALSSPSNELSRRRFIGGAAAASLLTLSACDSSGSARSPQPTASTRIVDTAQGKIPVPADPQRVVCIDYFTAIFLLELGLTPIGGIDYSWVDRSTMYPPYIAPLKDLNSIGQITATNYEKVTALDPDLILGPTPGSRYDNSKGAMATLSAVAPVASVNFGKTGDWRAPFAQAADIVNRTAKLAPLIAGYDQTVASIKAKYAGLLTTTSVTIVDYAQSGQYAVDLANSGSGVVLADVGIKFAKASAAPGDESRSLSFEDIDQLSDSDIILYRSNVTGKPGTGLANVFALDGWKQLPAVRAGHTYPIGWIDLCTYRWAQLALNDFAAILEKYRESR